jgi:hypothetical protein
LPTKPFPALDDKLLKQATANFLLTDGMGIRHAQYSGRWFG